jgi:O-antigen/teichoic acid export membrane protein
MVPDDGARGMSVARNLARIGRQSAIYGLGSVAATLLGVVLLPLYTRQLTPAEFGDAELALRLVLLVAILARLGLVNAFFRFFFDTDDPERRRTVFRTAFWTLQATTLVGALLTAATAPWIGATVFTAAGNGVALVLLIGLGVYVTVNYELTSALFRVQERAVAYSIRTVINLLATAGFSYLFLVVFSMGAPGLLLGAYAGQFLVYLGVLVEQRAWLGRGLERPLLREMLSFSVPLMPAGAAMWAVMLINRPIVLAIAGAGALGVLGVSFRIGTGVMLLVTAFQLAWPAFAYSIKDDGEAKRTYAAVMSAYLALMGWAAAALVLVAPWLLRLLVTEAYYGAIVAVTPIALAAPLYGGYFIAAIGVGRVKKNRFNWIIVGIAAAAEVIALLILVPRYGIAGAGWAVFIAYATMFVLMLWREHRVFPVPYRWFRIVRIPVVIVAGLIAASFIPDEGFASLLLRVVVAILIPLAYLGIGVLARGEIRRLLELMASVRSRTSRTGDLPAEAAAGDIADLED